MEGSFADGSAMATSDLDLAIVFRDRFETGEFDEARKLAAGCRSHESLELDVGVYDELSLSRGVPPMLKLGGRLIWGDEVVGRGSSAAQRDALWLMERIPYRDEAVRAAATAVAERAGPSLRGLAIRATARLEAAR